MKLKVIFSLSLLCIYFSGKGQTYIVGETDNMHSVVLDQTISDSELELDIDCDAVADITFNSHSGNNSYNDWPRLSFHMDPETEVINHQMGRLSTFKVGDAVLLNSDIWTPHLDFVYGVGVMGEYGIKLIEEDFIIFRKKRLTDTVYAYLEVSTNETWMQFHRLISTCPTSGIVSSTSNPHNQQITMYPNPFSDMIICDIPNAEVTISNLEGIQMKSAESAGMIDVRDLPKGMYIVMVKNEGGGITRTKMQKL